VNRSVHALKPPSDGTRNEFGAWLRRRPSAPLVALARRRLTTFDADRIRHSQRGEDAARGLPGGVFHPGRKPGERTHWVFPVAVEDPERTIEMLRGAGFDATGATSSIAAVEPPPDREEARPEASVLLMEHVVFVPVYPGCRIGDSIGC
jgi:perosamine synthetase